ncbi:hypothetical protein GF373_17540 [bacterium]|nr:hypothetical protein [bacterium]
MELYSITVGQSGYMPTNHYVVDGKERAKECVEYEAEEFKEAYYIDDAGDAQDEFTVEKDDDLRYEAEHTTKHFPIPWIIEAAPIPDGSMVGFCASCKEDLKTGDVARVDGSDLICHDCA